MMRILRLLLLNRTLLAERPPNPEIKFHGIKVKSFNPGEVHNKTLGELYDIDNDFMFDKIQVQRIKSGVYQTVALKMHMVKIDNFTCEIHFHTVAVIMSKELEKVIGQITNAYMTVDYEYNKTAWWNYSLILEKMGGKISSIKEIDNCVSSSLEINNFLLNVLNLIIHKDCVSPPIIPVTLRILCKNLEVPPNPVLNLNRPAINKSNTAKPIPLRAHPKMIPGNVSLKIT